MHGTQREALDELQEQNQQLLMVIRDLRAQQEQHEQEIANG